MEDRLVRGYFPRYNIRFALCQTALLCTEAVQRHRSDWLASWLLSEALTTSSLVSVNLNHTEKFTLRWMYPGPVGTILADANEDAEVRGFPQRLRLLDQAKTLEDAIGGEGRLSAITSLPDRVIHTGITAGVFQDVPRDMAHLLSLSFQIETAMNVGLILSPREPIALASAIGVLLQPLPSGDMEVFEGMRSQLENQRFQNWLEESPYDLETVIERLSPEGDRPEILEEITPRFSCHCSREKVESVLLLFDSTELRDMLEQEGRADVNCHFCAELYTFSRSEIETMLDLQQSGHA